MVQQFQKWLDATLERFHKRWETQASFRATWGVLICAVALLFLCSTAFVGSNLLSGLFVGAGGATHYSVAYNTGNGSTSNFAISTGVDGGTAIPTSLASPVATLTFSPTNTPTASPGPKTPTATPKVTDTPTPTDTPTGTAASFTVTATVTPMIGGQNATITNIQTNPQQSGQTLTIGLQFGQNPNCTAATTPSTVTLDNNGASPGPIMFTVPNCAHSGDSVTATYTISGAMYTDSSFGTVQ
jgi:hypothetical protein